MAALPFSGSLETQNKVGERGRQLCVRERAGEGKTKLARGRFYLWSSPRSLELDDAFAEDGPGLALGDEDERGVPVREMKASLASRRTRSERFSTIPRSKKGIAVAATYSFALRGILASGSHRKSCAERKKVSSAQQVREAIST